MPDDEKPKNIWELLHQETWWVSKEKEWIHLSELDLRYARNILHFVEERASRYGMQVAAWLDYTVLTTTNPFQGDIATDSFESIMNEMWEESFLARRKCDVWWASLEFPRALKNRVKELEAEEKEEA